MSKAVQRARDPVKLTESDWTEVQQVDPNGLVGRVQVYFLWKPKFRFRWRVEESETRINWPDRSAFEMCFKFGETTLLVPEVYPMCAIGPSNLKRAQLVP